MSENKVRQYLVSYEVKEDGDIEEIDRKELPPNGKWLTWEQIEDALAAPTECGETYLSNVKRILLGKEEV